MGINENGFYANFGDPRSPDCDFGTQNLEKTAISVSKIIYWLIT